MVSVIVPVVDLGNPMYCPDITASGYLRRLRQISPSSRHSGSFAHSLNLSSCDAQMSSHDTSYLKDTFLLHQHKVHNPPILSSSTIALPPSAKRKVDEVSCRNGNSQLKKRKMSHLESSSSAFSSDASRPHFPILFDAIPSQDSSESNFQDLNDILLENFQPSPRRVAKLGRKWT